MTWVLFTICTPRRTLVRLAGILTDPPPTRQQVDSMGKEIHNGRKTNHQNIPRRRVQTNDIDKRGATSFHQFKSVRQSLLRSLPSVRTCRFVVCFVLVYLSHVRFRFKAHPLCITTHCRIVQGCEALYLVLQASWQKIKRKSSMNAFFVR